jgi:hypothetical protein
MTDTLETVLETYELTLFGHGIVTGISPDGLSAVLIFNDEIVKRFTGETGWMDASREAMDKSLRLTYEN